MSDSSFSSRIVRAPFVTDAGAVERAWESLKDADPAAHDRLQACSPARPLLDGVFANSPYLTRVARRRAGALADALGESPEQSLKRLMVGAAALGEAQTIDELQRGLREAKLDAHLLTALADLGGVWRLADVTGALARFADACVEAALRAHMRFEHARNRLGADTPENSGFVVLAMGKHGAFELNYSSDIDILVLFDRDRFPVANGQEPQSAATALTRAVAKSLQDVTADGYVFRVDLRLRPDPGATPPAVNLAAAQRYYEALGQTWERAALIKARACAGDRTLGETFLREIAPFIWRRSLDFAAIEDLYAMKRQIHVHASAKGTAASGADVKRGFGGIREVEFFVQGQQLIHGGRDPRLRRRGTLEALEDLVTAGHVARDVADAIAQDYCALRDIEHRIQMIDDQPTHRVPADADARGRVAALYGSGSVAEFDSELEERLARVRCIAGELLSDAPHDADAERVVIGSVDDSDASLAALRDRGYARPERVTEAVRGWRAGRVPATRSQRARELLDRVLPGVIEAAADTGDPDASFIRFSEFFENLHAGVQTLSMFASEPEVLRAVMDVLSLAPKLGVTLARQPELLDAMLDAEFRRSVVETTVADTTRVAANIDAANDFESALNAARRDAREGRFRIGVQALMGGISALEAGQAYAVLADAVVGALADAARAEVARRHGAEAGEFAVLGLGKLGGREMSATSDLDLMAVYAPGDDATITPDPGALGVDTHFARVTQRLITALSAATEEGDLYEVDMQLRPSGKAGPIAVRFSAFETYYRDEAWTWEMMALTRARVVAGDAALSSRLADTLRALLTRERDAGKVFRDVADMRARLAAEKPAKGPWDIKLSTGGLVDMEFTLQALQLVHAHESPEVLAPSSRDALLRLREAGRLPAADADVLLGALSFQLDLTQTLSVAVEGALDPDQAPRRLKERLCAVGRVETFEALWERLAAAREQARGVFERHVLSRA